MMPVSDGMSDTTKAIYRRSPLHLTRGSFLDVPQSVSVTSAEHRADIKNAVLIIKGKVPSRRMTLSASCMDFQLPKWQDTQPTESGASGASGARCSSVGGLPQSAQDSRPQWSFEKVPSLLPSPLERDTGMLGRPCAGKPPCIPVTTKFTSLPWPGGVTSGDFKFGHKTSTRGGVPRFAATCRAAGDHVRGADGRFLGF
mmetsp:Transcript_29822/g.55842  ORF Transcript_29822/g.55842 Transcript_29822/m.55842 type:complete len:199 (-) Transcript_29822:108-704(-)